MDNNKTQKLELKQYKNLLLENLQKMKKEYSFDPKSLIVNNDPEEQDPKSKFPDVQNPISKFIEKSKDFMTTSMK